MPANLTQPSTNPTFNNLADYVGNTPLVALDKLPVIENISDSVSILAKLEGNNPASSVKDRAAFNMIMQAEKRGDIKPGDTLIEATSGNTGIALAMVAAMRGYDMVLFMPANSTQERKDAMAAYGATLIEVEDGIEAARDQALAMQAQGGGLVLNQFSNPDNRAAHYQTTGPELWAQTQGRITHFISSMGTTGTISGTGKYLKEQNCNIQVIGLQPDENASIAGIRNWSPEYRPKIFDASVVDRIIDITQIDAEVYMRKLARTEGIMAGVSSGAAAWAAIQVAKEIQFDMPDAVIVFIVCDRGDRYLSTGLYNIIDDDLIIDGSEVTNTSINAQTHMKTDMKTDTKIDTDKRDA